MACCHRVNVVHISREIDQDGSVAKWCADLGVFGSCQGGFYALNYDR